MIDKQAIEKIKQGAIFVYPTDTIYGIGCDARNKESVERIRKLKSKEGPFTIIPHKEWREKYFDFEKGPTFIVKNPVSLPFIEDTIGIRIPDHWILDLVDILGFPIVTTSVNKAGEPPMTKVEDLPFDVDIIIDDGEIIGKPSKIINLVTNEVIR